MIPALRMASNDFSIKVKFTLFTVLIGLVSFGIAAHFSSQFMAEELGKQYQEKAFLIWKHLIHELQEAMIFRNHAETVNILDAYRAERDILELRIFDHQGGEVFSDHKGPPEARVEEALKTGAPAKFHKEINQKEGGRPISSPFGMNRNAEGCHGKSEGMRGAFLLSFSTEP